MSLDSHTVGKKCVLARVCLRVCVCRYVYTCQCIRTLARGRARTRVGGFDTRIDICICIVYVWVQSTHTCRRNPSYRPIVVVALARTRLVIMKRVYHRFFALFLSNVYRCGVRASVAN